MTARIIERIILGNNSSRYRTLSATSKMLSLIEANN